MRHARNWKRWHAVVVWLGVLAGASGASAQAVDPCDGQGTAGAATEITGAGLEMPVPNTGVSWSHTAGSGAHQNRDSHALDLNVNPSGLWNFDRLLPALASAAGTVRFAGSSTCGYGNNVMVEHAVNGSSFYTHYAHLDPTLLVSVGDTVSQGQALGYISNSGLGGSGNEHLHWSVRQGTTAKYASVNGQSTQSAQSSSLSLSSDTRMIWLDDFSRAGTWENVPGGSAAFSVQNGQLRIQGPGTVRAKQPIYVRPENAPYRLKYAVRTERLRTGQGAAVGLRLECLRNVGDATPLRTVFYTAVTETYGGWSALAFPITFGPTTDLCPMETRFVRPVLAAGSNAASAVLVDWVGLEERTPVLSGGYEQFNAYAYGGVRRFTFNHADRTLFSRVEVVGAASRAALATSAQVLCTFAGNAGSGVCTQPLTTVTHLFYSLRFWNSAGQYRDIGPVGPVDVFTRAWVPGLGNTQVKTVDFQNIPLWANYPYATFDNSIDNYGIINYAANAGYMIFTPDVPVNGLTTFQAYYGGNTTRATVYAMDDATSQFVSIGQVTNTPLNWASLRNTAWPARTREIWVHFQRLNPDYFLHVDEIIFF